MKLPIGIRQHNPGNIRIGEPWHGVLPPQPGDQFCRFKSPQFGIRALARLIVTYVEKHGLDTIRGIINRWAPPNGRKPNGETYTQNTGAYIATVAAACGVDADDTIDCHDYATMFALVSAIIRHENGDPREFGRKTWYERAVIDEGLRRVGIIQSGDAASKRADRDPEGVAIGTAGASAIGGTAGSVYLIAELREANKALRQHGEETGDSLFVIAPLVITIIAAFVALRYWKKRKKIERD